MNIYISTHLWQFNLYFDHIYGKTISFLLTWSTLDEGTHGMVRPGFFHIAASLLIHPRWGYVALGSNVGDRCECPKIGSTPGGFDRFDLHIGILTIDLNMKPLYDIFKHETLIWYIYIIYITLDLNMKHGKITLSIGVLFDVERFLREYLLCIWYSSYGSMIVPRQPSGWYPPINKFSSMVKLQILRHPMFFLGEIH